MNAHSCYRSFGIGFDGVDYYYNHFPTYGFLLTQDDNSFLVRLIVCHYVDRNSSKKFSYKL